MSAYPKVIPAITIEKRDETIEKCPCVAWTVYAEHKGELLKIQAVHSRFELDRTNFDLEQYTERDLIRKLVDALL